MEKFHTALSGYNKQEVNLFVNDVISKVEGIVEREKQKDAQINELTTQLNRYKNIENTLNRVVIVAEEAGHQIKKTAQRESEQMIDNARKNANQIVTDALAKAENAQREVENLQRSMLAYKNRIRDVLQNQLKEIDELDVNFKR